MSKEINPYDINAMHKFLLEKNKEMHKEIPSDSFLPSDYEQTIDDLKRQVQSANEFTQRLANVINIILWEEGYQMGKQSIEVAEEALKIHEERIKG